jgi:hypothetical protein
MKLKFNDPSPLKRPFLAGGIVAGIVVSVRYLYRNHRLGMFPADRLVPDPVWTQFVNVALVMFVAVYLANLLRRIVEMVKRKGKQG